MDGTQEVSSQQNKT